MAQEQGEKQLKIVASALADYNTVSIGWNFPWCAAYLNYLLNQHHSPGTGSNMARSFLTLGVSTAKPKLGDIVVLWRISKDSSWGHCGLYIREDADSYYLLGGNQDEVVKIKQYPKEQLLDIRTNYV